MPPFSALGSVEGPVPVCEEEKKLFSRPPKKAKWGVVNLLRYLEKFEDVVDGDRPLYRVGQVDLDLDLKLTPTSLGHLNVT